MVSNAVRQQTQDSILNITNEAFDAMMTTNIYAPFWIIKAALPHLQPGAAIILHRSTSSSRRMRGGAGQPQGLPTRMERN